MKTILKLIFGKLKLPSCNFVNHDKMYIQDGCEMYTLPP